MYWWAKIGGKVKIGSWDIWREGNFLEAASVPWSMEKEVFAWKRCADIELRRLTTGLPR